MQMSSLLSVTSSPPTLRRCSCGGECDDCKRKRVQMQQSAHERSSVHSGAAMSSVASALQSPGQPLEPDVRGYFEDRLNHSFAKVRIHADDRAGASAQAMGAAAYTVGSNIVFAPGRWSPESAEGRSLLAHELVHTMQQRDAAHGVVQPMEVGPVDDTFEREADAIAKKVTASPGVSRSTILPRSDVALEEGKEEEQREPEESAETPAAAASPVKSEAERPATPRQQLPPGELRIQRRTTVNAPTVTNESPAAIIKNEGLNSDASLGQTAMVLNGTVMRPGTNVQSALGLPRVTRSIDTQNSVVRCRLSNAIDITLGHEVRVLSPAPRGGWRGTVTVDDVRTLGGPVGRACRRRRGADNVSFTVRGRPSDRALVTRVQTAENEHVTENTRAFTRHMVPLHDRIAQLAANDTTTPCTTTGTVTTCNADDCVQKLRTDLGLDQRLRDFTTEQQDAVRAHDGTGGDHILSVDRALTPNCRSLTFRVDAR
jgi:hypothetical protein